MFSSMQGWQIRKPQRQLQQKGTSLVQQWQVFGPFWRRLDERLDRGVESFIAYRKRPEDLAFRTERI